MNSNTIIDRIARRIALAIFALAMCLTATAGAARAAPAGPDFAAIDRYIEQEMREQRIPGLALGIVQGDQIVHLQGFGMADPSGRAVTPQTPFMIFSAKRPSSRRRGSPTCMPQRSGGAATSFMVWAGMSSLSTARR